MENMITMADAVGAKILDTSSTGGPMNTAVIIFGEAQLMAFMHRVEKEVKQDLLNKLQLLNRIQGELK
jgi:hypothetical protein